MFISITGKQFPTTYILRSNPFHYISSVPIIISRHSPRLVRNADSTSIGGTPFFFRNLDINFEGGLWKAWPPMPGVIWWVMQKTFFAWNSVSDLDPSTSLPSCNMSKIQAISTIDVERCLLTGNAVLEVVEVCKLR